MGLGKIENVWFGRGGYDDAMVGFGFKLAGSGWGYEDFWGVLERVAQRVCQMD